MDSTDVAPYRANALRIVGPWSVHDDSQGHLFYFNLRTKQSRWEMPREDPAFAKRDVSALEGELLMALMLQNALARSGPWSAHDTGSGTLYYFNEKTRTSVWERPAEWGTLPPPPPPLPLSDGEEGEEQGNDEEEAQQSSQFKQREETAKLDAHQKQEEEEEERSEVEEEDEPPAEPTPEELEASRAREAAKQKSMDQFRQMLREKRIMPFCKWSVALPRIAVDPRFMAVPTMEERREIFDRFVEHRREDLQQEKKANLKRARKQFTELVREHFERNVQELVEKKKSSLSVFLTLLEDQVDADRYKKIQEDALAFLPLSVQEKLYTKVFDEFSVHAKQLQQEEERWRLIVLSSKITAEASWESDVAQELRKLFAEGKPADTKELTIATQQRVFEQVVKSLVAANLKNEERNTEKSPEPRMVDHAPKTDDRSRSRHDRHYHDDSHRKSSHRPSPSRSRSRSRGRSGRDRFDRRSRSRDPRRHDSHDHDRSRSRRHRSSSRSRRRRSRSYSSSRSRSPRR